MVLRSKQGCWYALIFYLFICFMSTILSMYWQFHGTTGQVLPATWSIGLVSALNIVIDCTRICLQHWAWICLQHCDRLEQYMPATLINWTRICLANLVSAGTPATLLSSNSICICLQHCFRATEVIGRQHCYRMNLFLPATLLSNTLMSAGNIVIECTDVCWYIMEWSRVCWQHNDRTNMILPKTSWSNELESVGNIVIKRTRICRQHCDEIDLYVPAILWLTSASVCNFMRWTNVLTSTCKDMGLISGLVSACNCVINRAHLPGALVDRTPVSW